MDQTIQQIKRCRRCDVEFMPYGTYANARTYCRMCLQDIRHENYAKRAAREGRNLRVPRGTPVLVVGVDPAVECQELRNDLRICFWGSRFVLEDFRRSVQEGCVDGLLVEHAGQRYAVRRGEMVMVQEGG